MLRNSQDEIYILDTDSDNSSDEETTSGAEIPLQVLLAYGELPEGLREGIINKDMRNGLWIGIFLAIIAMLGIAAFSVISFVAVPFAATVLINAWFAASVVYLSGISYGILNDFIGVVKNLPYFTLGHQPQQYSVIESNHRPVVAIAWGILATFGPAFLAAILFGTAITITGFLGFPFAAFVLPVFVAALPVAVLSAHLVSALAEDKLKKNPELDTIFNDVTSDLNVYQRYRFLYWVKDAKDKAAWIGNAVRNGFGYVTLPLLGIGGLAAAITLSVLAPSIPAFLFGASFSVFPPLGAAVLLATGIAIACIYLAVNHKKKVNNGYRLDFADDQPVVVENNNSTHLQLSASMPPIDLEKQRDLNPEEIITAVEKIMNDTSPTTQVNHSNENSIELEVEEPEEVNEHRISISL
jgi:hypothetical protein